MNNICTFCKKEFKHLRCHDKFPPKYCVAIRESLRCNNGCNAIITDESLPMHRGHCKTYKLIHDRDEFDRILEYDKNYFERKLEEQKQTSSQTITKLEHEVKQLQLELAKTIENHTKEYDYLSKRYDISEANYTKLATICANKTNTYIVQNNSNNNSGQTLNQYLLNTPPLDLTNPSKLQLIMEEFYTKAYFLQGSKGLASFLVEYYLTDTGKAKYLTSDASRFNFKFNADGAITNDKEARILINFVLPIVLKIIHEKFITPILNAEYGYMTDYEQKKVDELYRCNAEIRSLVDDNSDFCKRLVSMTMRDSWIHQDNLILTEG